MLKLSLAIVVSLFCQLGQGQTVENSASPAPAFTNDWSLLECVHDRHDCRHHAARAGYHHFFARFDPHTCHHEHDNLWACYVRD